MPPLTPELEAYILTQIESLFFDVTTFTNEINKQVSLLTANGLSQKQIASVLSNDLKNGGRIFGQLKNNTKAKVVETVNQSSKIGQESEYSGNEKFAWVTVGGHKVCLDCEGRTGMIMTYDQWETEGLPGTGWSVCQGYCYCVLDPTGTVGKKVQVDTTKIKTEKGASIRAYNPLAFNSAGKHTTVKDSIAWMEKHIANKVTLKKLKDIDIANELTATLADTFQTYKLKKLNKITGRATGSTWASANGGSLNISSTTLTRKGLTGYYQDTTINYIKRIEDGIKRYDKLIKEYGKDSYNGQFYLKHRNKLKKRLDKMDEFGFSRHNVLVEGEELRSIITHELGHTLHDQFSGIINASLYRNPKVNPMMAVQFNDRWTDVFSLCKATKGRKVYLRQGSKYYEPKGLGNIGGISEYASSDKFELFAESFAMYNSAERANLPDIIVTYFDDYLKALGAYF